MNVILIIFMLIYISSVNSIVHLIVLIYKC